MDIITGTQGLLAVVNSTLSFINNMRETKDRELALLRLLYLEINENLEVMKTVRLHNEAGKRCTDLAYKDIAGALSFAAHQAVVTTRILDSENLAGWEIDGKPIMVNRIEISSSGEETRVKRPMKVSQALKTVCVSVSVLQRLAGTEVSSEISTGVRYGVRLENIINYEQELWAKLLSSELVKPLETL